MLNVFKNLIVLFFCIKAVVFCRYFFWFNFFDRTPRRVLCLKLGFCQFFLMTPVNFKKQKLAFTLINDLWAYTYHRRYCDDVYPRCGLEPAAFSMYSFGMLWSGVRPRVDDSRRTTKWQASKNNVSNLINDRSCCRCSFLCCRCTNPIDNHLLFSHPTAEMCHHRMLW
jgi:hypothetical protein